MYHSEMNDEGLGLWHHWHPYPASLTCFDGTRYIIVTLPETNSLPTKIHHFDGIYQDFEKGIFMGYVC